MQKILIGFIAFFIGKSTAEIIKKTITKKKRNSNKKSIKNLVGKKFTNPPDFNLAFSDGKIIETSLGKTKISVKEIGKINLKSGELVAADLWSSIYHDSLHEKPFLNTKMKAGKYSVFISLAHEKENPRIACSKIEFNKTKAVKWTLALTSKNKKLFRFPVESGTAAYTDSQTLKFISKKTKNEKESFRDDFEKQMTKMHNNIQVNKELNIVAFNSGWGDGVYASYWGYDKNNKLVSLVTNFGVYLPK